MDVTARMMNLFAGLDRVYGVYRITGTDERGKKIGLEAGDRETKRGKVTRELWQLHLDGKQSLGLTPIRDDSTCVYGAIDVDDYTLGKVGRAGVVAKFADMSVPVVPCQSKSGGVHAYLFAKNPVPAKLMRDRLKEIARAAGFGDCEIFPKQESIVSDKDCGSWINLPYFGGLANDRYGLYLDGEAMPIDEFLDVAEAMRQPDEFFGKAMPIPSALFSDGPPCLQELVQLKGFSQGQRNNLMFASAVYAHKSEPTRWREKLHEINKAACTPPLPDKEVEEIIASVARRRSYKYKCRESPLIDHCDGKLCRLRAYGVGRDGQGDGGGSGEGSEDAKNESFPRLGQLRKLMTIPPVWFWDTTAGRTIELATEELQSPRLFQKRCMESLNMMPVMPSQQAWTTLVNESMARVLEIEAPKDSSDEGQVWELLEKFCTGKVQAQNEKEVLLGKPWNDGKVTWFRMRDFRTFLDNQKFRGKMTATHELAAMFHRRGLQKNFIAVGKKGANVWGIASFGEQPAMDVPDSITKDDGEPW